MSPPAPPFGEEPFRSSTSGETLISRLKLHSNSRRLDWKTGRSDFKRQTLIDGDQTRFLVRLIHGCQGSGSRKAGRSLCFPRLAQGDLNTLGLLCAHHESPGFPDARSTEAG